MPRPSPYKYCRIEEHRDRQGKYSVFNIWRQQQADAAPPGAACEKVRACNKAKDISRIYKQRRASALRCSSLMILMV